MEAIKKSEPHTITILGCICARNILPRLVNRSKLYQYGARETLYGTFKRNFTNKAVGEAL